MTLENTSIAVTGSGGFVGRQLCRQLSAAGASVRSMVRGRSDLPGDFQFDLSQKSMDPDVLKPPLRALVHCAWDLNATESSEADSINVQGTQWLIDRCLAAGVEQFVFISSMAAHADAQSSYGRTKWEIENRLLALPNASSFSTIITPGTIIGSGGVFAKTRELVKKLPIVPVFYASGGRRLQTVHIADLCVAIISSIVNRVTGRLCIAEDNGVTPKDFYRGAAMLEKKRPMLLPFPGDVALLGVRMLESIGLKPPVSSSNLHGLKHLRHFDVQQSVRSLGCDPMPGYWRSLERQATEEGAADIAAECRAIAGAESESTAPSA